MICHTGSRKVFSITTYTGICRKSKDLVIFGGGVRRGAVWGGKKQIVFDLCGSWEPAVVTSNPLCAKEIHERFSLRPVKIIWQDFSIPRLSQEDWKALLYMIVRLRKEDSITSVLMSCEGGHGRTGTALAILAGLSGVCPKTQCPVSFIRERYCEYAVETVEQLDYIEAVTELRVSSSIATQPVNQKGGYNNQRPLNFESYPIV